VKKLAEIYAIHELVLLLQLFDVFQKLFKIKMDRLAAYSNGDVIT